MSASNLMYWLMAYKMSNIIMLLSEFGVFDTLAEGAKDIDELSSTLKLSKKPLYSYLDLLSEASIVHCKQGLYELPAQVANLLPMIKLESLQSKWHANQQSILKTLKDERLPDCMQFIVSDKTIHKTYLQAMSNSARAIALNIYKIIQKKSCNEVLDIGGADGALDVFLAKFLSQSSFSVVDKEPTKAFFDATINFSGNPNQFIFIAQDLYQDFTKDFLDKIKTADIIILSNILHLLNEETSAKLLTTLHSIAKKNSVIIIYDQFYKAGQSINTAQLMTIDWAMYGSTFDYTINQFKTYLEEIGFSNIQIESPQTLPGTLFLINL